MRVEPPVRARLSRTARAIYALWTSGSALYRTSYTGLAVRQIEVWPFAMRAEHWRFVQCEPRM
jgi:hypothetical protein